MEVAPARPLTPVTPSCRSAEMPSGGKPTTRGADPMTASRCSSEPHLKRRMILTPKLARWESMDPPEPNESQNLLSAEVKPVPICKSDSVMGIKRLELEQGRGAEITKQGTLIISGEEHKMQQPANHKTADTISTENQDNQNLRVASVPTTSVGSYTSFGTNSGVHHHKTRTKVLKSHKSQNYSLIVMLSAIYAKLLVVVGICFPLAEVISRRIPVAYYEGFYLYLYFGSIAFLLFVYVFLLKTDPSAKQGSKLTKALANLKSRFITKESAGSSSEEANTHHSSSSTESLNQQANKKTADESYYCGNFYLRLGAVVFGIGSMIYSGLEFGQFFELEVGTPCYNILYGLTPTTRMAFTFVQMHFIFLNFKICVNKYVALVRFGLMHLIATNICVWLHVVVQETKHGILSLTNVSMSAPIKFMAQSTNQDADDSNLSPPFEKTTNHSRLHRSLPDSEMYMPHECRRSNIMGELVQEASHFLFPCSIQYSLICAAILYIMWKKIGSNRCSVRNTDEYANKPSIEVAHHSQHHQVDCAKANKGLFTGILVLVLAIISIILFFVLIGKPEYKIVAIMEARITELVLYLLSSFSVVIALFQVRELRYSPYHNIELDSILLIVAQSGLYVYTLFSIIGAYFTQQQNILLVLLTSLICIIQATLQTVFILDASRRYAHTASQVHRKPGREMVTFLLVCNFAMWVVNTLQTQQTDSNPIQLSFYGFWAWTVITHITTPLAIFFRFHSAVCLCDIWKRTYKMKREFL